MRTTPTTPPEALSLRDLSRVLGLAEPGQELLDSLHPVSLRELSEELGLDDPA